MGEAPLINLERKHLADIFISHIAEEAHIAGALVRFLREFQLESFVSSDQWQLKAGERWFERVIQELDAAKVVILLLSESSAVRPWINFEGGYAWASPKKKVIPLCIGNLKKGEMPRPYSDLQGLNLRTDYYHLVRNCLEYVKDDGRPSWDPVPFPSDDKRVKPLLDELDRFAPRFSEEALKILGSGKRSS